MARSKLYCNSKGVFEPKLVNVTKCKERPGLPLRFVVALVVYYTLGATMATTTVTLEPENITRAVKSLKTEFARAKMGNIKTITKKGAVHVEMPVAGLTKYQFSSSAGHCLWKTPKAEILVRSK